MNTWKKYGIYVAIVFAALFFLGGGGAKLASVEQVHHSFAVLGLPRAIALVVRPLSALAAAGLACIMVGALYYHLNYTPISQGVPALVLLLLCGLIFINRRSDMLKFGSRQSAERA